MILIEVLLLARVAAAQDATWLGATGDWNTASNWSPAVQPIGTAIFYAGSNIKSITFSTATVLVNAGGTAAAGYPIDQAFISRIAPASQGAIALATNSSNNLDFNAAGLTQASLGAVGSATYGGTLTAAGGAFRLGGGGGMLTLTSRLIGQTALLINPGGSEPWGEVGVQGTLTGLSRGVDVTAGGYTSGVTGVTPAPAAAVLGIGIDTAASDALHLFIRYQGLFSANQVENAFSGGLSVSF